MRPVKTAATLSLMAAMGTALSLVMPAPAALAQQGAWTKIKKVPSLGPGVEGMAVGVINGKIIAAFGFDPGSKLGDTKTTRIYDPATNSWQVTSPPAPGGERSEAGTVVVNDKLYVVGGGDRLGAKDNLTVYDAGAGTWTALAPLPLVPKGNHGKMKPDKKAALAAAAANGFIYAIGGRDAPDGPCNVKPPKTNTLSSVDRYNISTDTWDLVAPMTGSVTPRSDLAAVTINGKIWVFGGCSVSKNGATQLSKEVDMYDPATDTWVKKANLPEGACAFNQVVAVGTTVYIIGGYFGTKAPPGKQVWAYDTLTGATNTDFATMPTARSEMGVAIYNGSIYTLGGSIPAYGNSTNAAEKFTP